MGAFHAVIAGEEYGAGETPETLGLYGGRYTIEFHPGKSWRAVSAYLYPSDTRCPMSFQGSIMHRVRWKMTC